MRRYLIWLAPLLCLLSVPVLAGAAPMDAAPSGTSSTDSTAAPQEYIYDRDVIVPPYQTLREFFDMPNRPGHYEVTMVSEAIGPLTFKVIRVKGEHEIIQGSKRSYNVGSHDFQQRFDNPTGNDDLIVQIANSNPATNAKVTVYVVELP
jgi:hypothetical protein